MPKAEMVHLFSGAHTFVDGKANVTELTVEVDKDSGVLDIGMTLEVTDKTGTTRLYQSMTYNGPYLITWSSRI